MALEDFMNDPEADAELRAGTKRRPKVTQEEHKRYVQDRLCEIVESLVSTSTNSPDSAYHKAVGQIMQLSVTFNLDDISRFGARLDPYAYNGVILSALIQNLDTSTTTAVIDVTKMPELHYFGYKLNRDVVVKGNLGGRTAERMESGMLIVEGNCGGPIGPFMKGGIVDVRGTIGDLAAIRYGGTIKFRSNLGNYYLYNSIDDVRRELEHEQQYPLEQIASEIRGGSPVLLHTEFKRMLNPKFVQLICEHNIGIYERELSGLIDTNNRLIDQHNELVDKHNPGVVGDNALRGTILVTGIAGIFFPPLLATTALAGLIRLAMHKPLKLNEKELESLERQIRGYEPRIEKTQQLIQEARRFYQ